MSKLKKKRRNGKRIKTGIEYKPVLTAEAMKLIKQGDSKELYDSYGKVKKKYIQINRIHHA